MQQFAFVLGGYNLKKLQSEFGVQISTVDEFKFSIFAPNKETMGEFKQAVDTILEEKREPTLGNVKLNQLL